MYGETKIKIKFAGRRYRVIKARTDIINLVRSIDGAKLVPPNKPNLMNFRIFGRDYYMKRCLNEIFELAEQYPEVSIFTGKILLEGGRASFCRNEKDWNDTEFFGKDY